ncbi:MAG: two-component system, sensory transduction histidine kinase [Bryobacterales bacterium]|nr:two-component system, sensory transduction histidine kinase [Bryobacterales bacterium]
MYCACCGKEIPENFRFCSECGAPVTQNTSPARPPRVLRRPHLGRKIAGVCAGLANYMDLDVTLVRIIVLCLIFWPPGIGLILYVVCWIVVPQEPFLLPPARPSVESAPVQS